MHITDRRLRKLAFRVEDVCYSAIRHEVLVHWHFQIFDFAICAEDLAQVRFFEVLGEFFDNNLCASG
jgi:hypothetical protein